MKSLFPKLTIPKLRGETGFRFCKAELTEQTGRLQNPARGWYQIHTFDIRKEPDFEELEWCLDKDDTLALLLMDIGGFYDRELDEDAISRIGRIVGFFAEAQYDVILRIVYDHEGKGMEREPSSFSLVERHLEQLGTLFREWKAVFVFQGMLVGNWGEMHGSRHLTADKMKRMAGILGGFKKNGMYLAVRRPAQWRLLHTYTLHITEMPEDGMGLFDDGMFGSKSHLGTFDTGDRVSAGWDSPWGAEPEMEFEEELGNYVPNGGEAVYGEGYTEKLNSRQILDTLRKMHITYLNKAHDIRTLDIWKQWSYTGSGVWAGKSVYDYIGAHLGYRFLIRDVEMKITGQQCLVEIAIENVGFAGFYQDAEVFLECWGEGNRLSSFQIDCDMTKWKAGKVQKISCEIDLQDGILYLYARRKQDGRCIRFANLSREDGRAELGSLQKREVKK
ncbi:MAG: DUF4832 domain-containing protein [Bacteroidales bacterium]|nr:DUF4832 domain-containing protein [Lachnoclostridium sp.]MCM1383631.1 DUF4832 domain-containing protein [Lachnoclostridium sp.]MCM1465713.1 DUF4832 domain-containing protein [Bacteroidales bacterium]